MRSQPSSTPRPSLSDAARRYWWAAPAVLVFLALALWAGTSLAAQTTATRPAPPPSPAAANCSPEPCAAPLGFEVDVSDVRSQEGLLTMQLRFRNGTRAQSGEPTISRHTSSSAFLLVIKETGARELPVVNGRCPAWPELNIGRGANAGPELLCFQAAPPDTHVTLVWSPDLGFFFNEVAIPLN